jgi:voltage-gated potassium channel
MLAFTLLILPVLGIEFFMHDQVLRWPVLRLALDVAVVLIWVAFAAELVLMLVVSEDRMEYLKRHWVNVLIVVLPTLAFLRGLQLVRLVQLAKTGKMLKVYRLRSLALRGYESLLALSVIERILHRDPEKLRAKLTAEIAKKEHEIAELRQRLEALDERRGEEPADT